MATSGVTRAFDAIIACSAILGNGLVMFVMTVRREQFSSFTNRLIRHQSIIDFISGLVFLALNVGIKQSTLLKNLEENLFSDILCRFVHSDYFVWSVTVVSTCNLVVISLERFLATCYPVKHRNYCSLFKIKVSMCAAWIIGFTYAINTTLLFHVNQKQCRFNHNLGVGVEVPVFCLVLLVEYIIPVVLMSFSYIRILLLLRDKLTDNGTVSQQADVVLSKAKRNVILTMLITGIMFFICWTPLEMMRLLFSFNIISTREPAVARVRSVFTGLVMCNMSVNPVVYCFKYELFRTQLKQLVRSRFGRNRVRPGEESIDGLTL